MIRAVVADDDEMLRLLLYTALGRDNRFEVVGVAADGTEALEQVELQDPDLLLLDLAMPGCDGLEVLQQLGGRDRPAVVVMSGFTADEAAARAIELGAAGYIVKGTDIGVIGDRIQEMLASRS